MFLSSVSVKVKPELTTFWCNFFKFKLESFSDKLLIELINGHRFHLKTLEKDAEQIALVINDKLDQNIRIKFHIQEDKKDKPEKKKPESAEHPLFMKVLETFDGEIIR